MSERSGVFDMIGPVMIGPSSSHTAGVVKIAQMAVRVLGGIPEQAEITFYNSFARTYEGHGSDRAVIGGLLNFATDDKRIKNSFDHAKEQGFEYSFKSIGNASTMHPNTIKIEATKGEKKALIIGESRGGGVIKITNVNSFDSNFSGALDTLIIQAEDKEGSIAFISSVLSQECNIATMFVSRKGKKQMACQVIEIDHKLNQVTIDYLKSLSWIYDIIYIPIIS
ncbi:L-serine ammonia-lyase, iron-sulfur-dependent subunit beta [Aureibacter tunicatorum]|uniref:L-serine dehydratase n=1 Tax=Aureibacter tunicatorum TaxID=866807 RepID=A0AAE4BSD1_9BACT|nr:L-serine ammonia-lyase, iron-sulfur-dependent subunit beta [Aureibacter tunicatorum]MDR6239636.1 L-serine dehydratase [Aureibacter tunicatorum]BDD04112.1 L-serine dehydratase [Aureibacter tunicatorum]